MAGESIQQHIENVKKYNDDVQNYKDNMEAAFISHYNKVNNANTRYEKAYNKIRDTGLFKMGHDAKDALTKTEEAKSKYQRAKTQQSSENECWDRDSPHFRKWCIEQYYNKYLEARNEYTRYLEKLENLSKNHERDIEELEEAEIELKDLKLELKGYRVSFQKQSSNLAKERNKLEEADKKLEQKQKEANTDELLYFFAKNFKKKTLGEFFKDIEDIRERNGALNLEELKHELLKNDRLRKIEELESNLKKPEENNIKKDSLVKKETKFVEERAKELIEEAKEVMKNKVGGELKKAENLKKNEEESIDSTLTRLQGFKGMDELDEEVRKDFKQVTITLQGALKTEEVKKLNGKSSDDFEERADTSSESNKLDESAFEEGQIELIHNDL